MSTAAVNSFASSAAPNAASPGSASTNPAGAATLANQNTFLQLMISELEHQDPTNPTDGTAFITQLAEFSSVQSQTQSASDLDAILQLLQSAAANASGASQSGTGSNSGTNNTSGTSGA